jgi:hypothetical protein
MKILAFIVLLLNTVFAFGECSAPSLLERAGVRLFLNPSTGTIYFSASNMNIDDYTVTIYDVTGKVIYQKVYGNGSTEINTINLDLSNGVYLMQLKDNSTNDVYKQKIVIQK